MAQNAVIAGLLAAVIWLTFGRESSDEAYERGFEEGIDQACQEIRAWNAGIYDTLRREKICF